MEAPGSSLSFAPSVHDSQERGKEEQRTVDAVAAAADPFLVEALENPRHRLTFLRMELDIQRFMENSDQHQFEFQHLPTSYLRCAAHRVAQHYGLQTMSIDNPTDGFASRVVAWKTPETRYPSVPLSDIPIKQPETEKSEQVKIVLRQRPNQASMGDGTEIGASRSLSRTVEERKEDYDKARARIFSAPSSPVSEADENDTVAIFRDMEKDRSDPDYDRSYDRYARGFVPTRVRYVPSHVMTPYVQWPTPAMVYAHSYDPFRHAIYPAPVCQQPLSFEQWSNR